MTDGSFNDLQNRIRSKVNEGKSNDEPNAWPIDIIPDTPILTGTTIIENWDENKFYSYPFTVNESGDIELGEPEEVRQQTNYIPISQKDNAGFVFKDEEKRLVTGPVAIPGCKDCDFERGEKILTVDEIADMVHAYNSEFRLVDKMHLFGSTGEIDGEAVENWTLKEELKTTNVQGNEVTLPIGTWMATTKITSDEAWEKVQNGTYKGYSGTYISRKDADNLKELLESANKSSFESQLKEAIKRTLIADLEDPVPVTISLVDNPCVENAIFTSVGKSANKAGRRFSNATTDKLAKGVETFKNAYDTLMGLFNDAMAERDTKQTDKINKSKLEVLDMNEDEVKKLVDEKVADATKTLKEENEALKADIESLKKDPDDEGKPADKKDPEDEPKISEEVQKELDDLKTENQSLKSNLEKVSEKLGIDFDDGSLEGSDDDPANKNKSTGDAAFYKEAGLKCNGRPLNE